MTRQEAYGELNITTLLIPVGYANRPQGANCHKYITVHETDNEDDGADADAHAKYLLGKDARKRRVSWHFTVDEDETIKHLPSTETAWHTGTSRGNSASIGIEMCVNGGTLAEATLNRTALLCAVLCKTIHIETKNIRQHHDWSGKDCPAKLRASGRWDEFIGMVEGFLAGFDW